MFWFPPTASKNAEKSFSGPRQHHLAGARLSRTSSDRQAVPELFSELVSTAMTVFLNYAVQ